jgi:hypothetical protein
MEPSRGMAGKMPEEEVVKEKGKEEKLCQCQSDWHWMPGRKIGKENSQLRTSQPNTYKQIKYHKNIFYKYFLIRCLTNFLF